jgi:hypothetical protein
VLKGCVAAEADHCVHTGRLVCRPVPHEQRRSGQAEWRRLASLPAGPHASAHVCGRRGGSKHATCPCGYCCQGTQRPATCTGWRLACGCARLPRWPAPHVPAARSLLNMCCALAVTASACPYCITSLDPTHTSCQPGTSIHVDRAINTRIEVFAGPSGL